MLQRICLVLSVCAIAFFLGRGLSQAGWSGLSLTSARDASSPVISVKKKKHHDDDNADNGLEQCTIVSKGGGMGCVAPQKLVCQKMKNGQKCCGCVGDKPTPTTTKTTPQHKSECAPGNPLPTSAEELYKMTCSNAHGSSAYALCSIVKAGPDGLINCCCNWTE
jgi:hypothetical protein